MIPAGSILELRSVSLVGLPRRDRTFLHDVRWWVKKTGEGVQGQGKGQVGEARSCRAGSRCGRKTVSVSVAEG